MPVNQELATAIKKAKSGRMMFAFIAKGTEGNLLIDRKVATKDVAEAKKELGGGTVWKGECFGEDGKLVFEVAKEPPGSLAGLLKRTIQKDAGLSMGVDVRLNAKLETEQEGGETEETPAPGAEKKDEAGAFASRLKAILPSYQKAIQSPDTGWVEQLKHGFAQMQTAFKGQDFGEANAQLKALLQLLAHKPSAPGEEHVSPPGGDGDAFKNRLKQILPLYEKTKANVPTLPALMAQAMKAAGEKRFADGLGLLAQLVEQIKAGAHKPVPQTSESEEEEKVRLREEAKAPKGFVDFAKCRQLWDKALKDSHAGLQQFKKAVLADFPESAAEVASLDELLDDFTDELAKKLSEAQSAEDESKRKALKTAALRIVQKYIQTLEADSRFDAIDNDPENPYDGIKVGEPLLSALEELESKLDV